MRPQVLTWQTYEADRNGRPTLRVARLPALRWPGMAVWDYCGGRDSSRGRYELVYRMAGSRDTYQASGIRFRTQAELLEHLQGVGVLAERAIPRRATTETEVAVPARPYTSARREKPMTRAARLVKRVEEALKAGVTLHFDGYHYSGTAGRYHDAAKPYAIFRYSRTRGNHDDYFASAFSAADHLVEWIGTTYVIEALKRAAEKQGLRYSNLDTPIPWASGRRR